MSIRRIKNKSNKKLLVEIDLRNYSSSKTEKYKINGVEFTHLSDSFWDPKAMILLSYIISSSVESAKHFINEAFLWSGMVGRIVYIYGEPFNTEMSRSILEWMSTLTMYYE